MFWAVRSRRKLKKEASDSARQKLSMNIIQRVWVQACVCFDFFIIICKWLSRCLFQTFTYKFNARFVYFILLLLRTTSLIRSKKWNRIFFDKYLFYFILTSIQKVDRFNFLVIVNVCDTNRMNLISHHRAYYHIILRACSKLHSRQFNSEEQVLCSVFVDEIPGK